MPDVTFDFTGRVVLITGGNGNLGRAVARLFFDSGATVVVTDRRADFTLPFPDTGRAFAEGGVDVTDPAAANALVARVLERFGRIDVLVNTVGGYRAGQSVPETSPETWDFLWALNLRSTLNMCRAVVPAMLERRQGKIINVAAAAALQGQANSAAYAASKSAVVRLTESLSAEVKRQGINVNAVAPSVIDTPQNRAAMPNADFSLWVTPEALARVIAFLASDAAAPIHGVLLPVFGAR
ncbi:MAG: SDR family NAD(P)-dependent oxidoreductase [Anaerolineales bacterium]|nr:SDR family NAD(P)-dependent oxidoreductase [Anaerolineales bacterium]